MKLKDIPKIERPREKLAQYGAKKLSDSELLAIVLGSGVKGLNVLELSKKILKVVKEKGDSLSLVDLKNIKGLGVAKASQVFAVIALASRLTANMREEVLLSSDVWRLSADFRDSKREHLVVFYLDTQSCLIERKIISIGTLTESLVHPREVFESALALSASGVIVVHNHPSGSLSPSAADTEITKRLKSAGTLLGIELQDHIIVTKVGHISIGLKAK